MSARSQQLQERIADLQLCNLSYKEAKAQAGVEVGTTIKPAIYYFCDEPLVSVHSVPLDKFIAIGGEPSQDNFFDSSNRLVGRTWQGGGIVPVTRKEVQS